MRKLVAGVAIALLGTLIPVTAHADDNGFVNDQGKEAEFVAKINDLRQSHGLSTLELDSQLVAKARSWSLNMAQAGNIWHSHLSDGITENWHRLGENVGMGGSVDALETAFEQSPHHYENLVDPGFRYVGIGVTVTSDGTIFVSEEFMELASQPAPAAPTSAAGTPSTAAVTTPSSGTARPAEQPRSAPPALAPQPNPDRIVSVLDRLRGFDD